MSEWAMHNIQSVCIGFPPYNRHWLNHTHTHNLTDWLTGVGALRYVHDSEFKFIYLYLKSSITRGGVAYMAKRLWLHADASSAQYFLKATTLTGTLCDSLYIYMQHSHRVRAIYICLCKSLASVYAPQNTTPHHIDGRRSSRGNKMLLSNIYIKHAIMYSKCSLCI